MESNPKPCFPHSLQSKPIYRKTPKSKTSQRNRKNSSILKYPKPSNTGRSWKRNQKLTCVETSICIVTGISLSLFNASTHRASSEPPDEDDPTVAASAAFFAASKTSRSSLSMDSKGESGKKNRDRRNEMKMKTLGEERKFVSPCPVIIRNKQMTAL